LLDLTLYILREYAVFKIELQSKRSFPKMHFPLDWNGLAKSRTRFGLLSSFAETEDQWVTFCFGCIGNCDSKCLKFFRWVSKWIEVESEWNEKHRRVAPICFVDICGENVSLALINSSQDGGHSVVIPCSFSSDETYSLRHPHFVVAHDRRYRLTSVYETVGVLATI